MKINLNIENQEKHRILNMHKILKEQTNPTTNYNLPSDGEKLVNLVINENLCDFTNFLNFLEEIYFILPVYCCNICTISLI
jgi:hypothetical protein